jgi:hypothetical protein
VQRAGKPLAEAVVVFHPLDNRPRTTALPIGTCDAQGRFRLTTLRTDDGAPAGTYAITVELREPQQRGEEMVRDGKNLLPAKFSKPDTSPLRYEVIAGENEVPPLVVDDR